MLTATVPVTLAAFPVILPDTSTPAIVEEVLNAVPFDFRYPAIKEDCPVPPLAKDNVPVTSDARFARPVVKPVPLARRSPFKTVVTAKLPVVVIDAGLTAKPEGIVKPTLVTVPAEPAAGVAHAGKPPTTVSTLPFVPMVTLLKVFAADPKIISPADKLVWPVPPLATAIAPVIFDKSLKAIVFLMVDGVKNKLVPSYSTAPASGVVKFTPLVNFKGAVLSVAVPAFKWNNEVGDNPTPILPLFNIVNRLGKVVVLKPKVKVPKSTVVFTNNGFAPPSLTLVVPPEPVEVRPLV